MAGVEKVEIKERKVRHYTQCKYYKENYGRYMSWGMFLPMSRLQKPLYLVFALTHVPLLFYTSYLIFEEEFAAFTELIHFAILMILSTGGTVLIDSSLFENIIWYYETGFGDYGDTIDQVSDKEIKMAKSKLLKRKIFHTSLMYYTQCTAACSLVFLRPLYELLSGKYDNVSFKYNVNRLLPLRVWYPLDVTSWPVHILMLSVEYYLIFQTTFLAIGSIIIYISVSEELCAQIEILKITLKNITRRAKHLGKGVTTKENLRECLRRCVIHHCRIIEWFDMFQKLYSRVLWLILSVLAYMICLCAFITTMKADLTVGNKSIAVAFLVLEIFYLLVCCWYGEEITSESSDLHFEIYDSDWIDFQVDIKNYLLIIQQRAFHPLKMYGGLISVDLNTFSTICNTAYSYFNLLNASQN